LRSPKNTDDKVGVSGLLCLALAEKLSPSLVHAGWVCSGQRELQLSDPH
jgi:hypothetical protein